MSVLDNSVMPSKDICNPFRLQCFSLPNSIIYYITKNPSNSKLYKKLIQSCKYFYFKNPIVLFDVLNFDVFGKCYYFCKGERKELEIKNGKFKCWISGTLSVCNFNQFHIANLIPKIYRCDAIYLNLTNQNLLFNEFTFLASSAETCSFNNVIIQYQNGREAFLEEIIQNMPNLKKFYSFSSPHLSVNTVTNLLKIPHFSKLLVFSLKFVNEIFDIKNFYEYLKKYRNIRTTLHFANPISEQFQQLLEGIVDEIIENLNYLPPVITYPQMDPQKKLDIMNMHLKKCLLE